MRELDLHVEVDFSGFPLFACFAEESCDQAEQGGFIWKDACDASAAFEFLVDAFERIGGSQASLMSWWQSENGEALGQVFFQPGSKLGSGVSVQGEDFPEALLCGGEGGAKEDAADGASDIGALVNPWDVSLGVLLEVELAALPGDGPEDRFARSGHTRVVVADDEGDATEAALDKALKEGAPVCLGFTEGDTDAQNGAMAAGGDAQREKDGTVAELAVVADLFVAGIEDKVGALAQRAVAPFLEFCIEKFGAITDLGGADGGAAEFLDDSGDFTSGDALDIHFSEGELECLF